jgi:hypothetical protein
MRVLACSAALLVAIEASAAFTTSAREQAEAWLAAAGVREGPGKDGSFIAVGTASFAPSPDNGFAASREQAFLLASSRAKRMLVEFVGIAIESELRSRLTEGPSSPDRITGPAILDAIEKAERRAGGSARESAVAMSESTMDLVRTAARAKAGGAETLACFESGTEGEISLAVILRTSRVSRDLAAAATGRGPPPRSDSLPDAREWAGKAGEEELLRASGARILRDAETGSLALVSFGHADVRGNLPRDTLDAKANARIAAESAMRRFLGELIECESLLAKFSESVEIEGIGAVSFDESAFIERCRSTAASLRLPGRMPLREWDLRMPDGRGIVGAVLSWSPSSEALAIEFARDSSRGARPDTHDPLAGPGDEITARFATLPSAGGAEILRTPGGLAAIAIGRGRSAPKPGERPVADAIRRDRARRAACLNAKSEIARLLASSVEAISAIEESDARIESRESARTAIGRVLLASTRPWRSETEKDGDGWIATVWIWTTAEVNASSIANEGFPRFDTAEQAAERIAELAREGACELGTVSILVGPEGDALPTIFGIGIGAGTDGATVAVRNAEAQMARAFRTEVSGRDSLTREATLLDPFSPAGSRESHAERSRREREGSSVMRRRIAGKILRTSDGVVFAVIWSPPGE